jgi:hypothetical protein
VPTTDLLQAGGNGPPELDLQQVLAGSHGQPGTAAAVEAPEPVFCAIPDLQRCGARYSKV